MAAPRLIRSGWWVAALAIVLSAATLALLIRPHQVRQVGDGRDVASYGFDLDRCLVNRDRIVAGMPRDGLEVIDRPEWLTPADVDRYAEEERGKLLVPDDRVVGVELGGDIRAYPVRILRWHEVVHDEVGGVPVAVTYHPLSDAVVVLDRRTPNGVLSFGLSGLLDSSTQLLYDRDAPDGGASLWSPLRALAISGPRAGETLPVLPAAVVTWSAWRERHPDTRVLAPVPGSRQLYKRNPYRADLATDLLRFPVEPLPPSSDLGLKDRIVAVEIDGTALPIAVPRIAPAQASASRWVPLDLAGTRVEVLAGTTPAVAAARNADNGALLPLHFACWFAWHATHPDGPDPRPFR